METILRSFCVITCIVTGVYVCIIYYYFRSAKRILWFSGLCFALGIYANLSIGFYQNMLFDTGYLSGIADNIYLSSVALAALCMNSYTGLLSDGKAGKYHVIFNYLLFILASLSLLVPEGLTLAAHMTLSAFTFLVYVYALIIAIDKIKSGRPYFAYQVVAYVILMLASIFSQVLLFIGSTAPNPSVLAIPLYLICHAILMKKQYILSYEKTKTLSESLQNTIERINHSDNALMCTQMKADFLYKSLDLIQKKCDEDPYTAEDLTVSLSKYLRHTLNFQQLKGIVPLNNEIELTKAYIDIEKARNPKVKFEYKFPNPLPDFHIPPLSIQPLVENALEHAFNDSTENPKITITIIAYHDYYHIDISDNGTGMDEELANSLTYSLHESARIGVYNIHTRLINLFGKGLVIQSAPGIGTSISFVVPPDAASYIREKEAKEG